MRRNFTIILSLVFLLAAVSSVAGSVFANSWFHDLSTPLATILLLTLATSHWFAFKRNYALWIAIGLFFSLLGDIALLRPADYFLPGLIAFLFAHVAYLIAFTRDAKFPARFSIWLLFLSRRRDFVPVFILWAARHFEVARRCLRAAARVHGRPSDGALCGAAFARCATRRHRRCAVRAF